jgi:hypothetical protein
MNNHFHSDRRCAPKNDRSRAVEPKDPLTYSKATLILHQLSGKEGDPLPAGVEPQTSLELTILIK